ncbi:hypothetical protein [Novosphingobium sp. G106]|uniref:hypothetical protein n=1 Tax=Novosphingobium sp. G106 TaxID=2849500 RepID=UPI002810C834|nr:hypothetical protein [Novosphingobium sp. G106]
MTAFIREQGLLVTAEIDEFVAQAPVNLLAFQEGAARVPLGARDSMRSWLAQFEAGWNGFD